MKKTIKPDIVVLTVLLTCASLTLELWAEQKPEQKPEQKTEQRKDVSDPVLQEIITAFGTRMPRYIDKYGKEVFVSDGPVTRGSLMLALYEYDKSFKVNKKDFISKQEFTELVSKVNLLEAGSRAKSPEHASILDTAQVINDLMPNMPAILDSSLNNSKVFQGLKEQIAARGQVQGQEQPNNEQFKTTLDKTRLEVLDLSKKVDNMEKSGTQPKSSDSSAATGDVKKNLAITHAQLDKLEEKVNEIEKRKPESQVAKKDISQIITELTPNMPGILDNSLNNSKVFQSLKEQMADRGQGVNNEQFKTTLDMTRNELLDLSKRVDSVEKRKPESQVAKKDISQIINEITPNMPGILDNSLNNSKVFQSLKGQIAQRGQGSNDEQYKIALDQTRYELLDLSKRVDNMEKSNTQPKYSDSSLQTTGDIKKNLALTRAQLEKLEAKVSEMEKRKPELQMVKQAPVSEEAKTYTSTLAKVSMGISMVAALFIAR